MRRSLLAIFLLCALTSTATAHGLVPMLLKVEQTAPDTFQVSLKSGVPQAQTPVPVFPEVCQVTPGRRWREERAHWAVWRLHCTSVHTEIRLDGLGDYQAVAQLYNRDGLSHSRLLTAQSPSLALRHSPQNVDVLAGATLSGVVHLLAGWDHLLFIIGLTLWLRRGKPLLIAITSFTLGHSLTLALATTGLLTVPVTMAELAIAASLLFMAVQLSRPAAQRTGTAVVMAAPLLFGLLHGLGFANVLNAQGLQGADLIVTLLGFNLGLELAQLLAVAAVLLILLLMQRQAQHLQTVAVYAIGSLAIFWMWERALLLTV